MSFLDKKKLFSRFGLIILLVSTLLLTMIINKIGSGWRIDLTEDRIYTLSNGTHQFLSKLDKDIQIQLFYSDKQTKGLPSFRSYATRIQELLKEYTLASKGKITFQVVDPEPFSEEEDEANSHGLQAFPINNSEDKIYFGLVIKEVDGVKKETIGFIHPNKEQFLEYDLSKLIYSLTQVYVPKIALVNQIPVIKNPAEMIPMNHELAILSQLKKSYQVQELAADFDVVPEGIKELIVVHPSSLSERSRYAIDQFVLSGGSALIIVDPLATMLEKQDIENEGYKHDSSLPKLFKAWGIGLHTDKVVADVNFALTVGDHSGQTVKHIGMLGVDKKGFNTADPSMSSLKIINFSGVGALKILKEATTNVEVLLHSTKKSALFPTHSFNDLYKPYILYQDFKSSGEEYPFAVRITGDVKTAFPKGQPQKEGETDDKTSPSLVGHLSTSKQPINVVVIADTDWLKDEYWVQKNQFFGQALLQPFANNGDFLINIVDSLTGNSDLVSIRGRGEFARPFTKVNEIEQQAKASVYEKQKTLQLRLKDTEEQLIKLQTGEKNQKKSAIMSDEQQAEVDKFMQEKVKIRKELRDVQHQLNKDIERLGSQLKFINILVMPLLITLLAIGYRFWRRKKIA